MTITRAKELVESGHHEKALELLENLTALQVPTLQQLAGVVVKARIFTEQKAGYKESLQLLEQVFNGLDKEAI